MMKGVPGALLRYRFMAYLVGTLLVVLVCIGVPLEHFGHNDVVVMMTGIPHGYLYMVLLITAFDLGRRVKWSWTRLILIALAGTVPFLSFVAERSATKSVRAWLAARPAGDDSAGTAVGESAGQPGESAEPAVEGSGQGGGQGAPAPDAGSAAGSVSPSGDTRP